MCGIAGFFNPDMDYTKERKKWNTILNNMNRTDCKFQKPLGYHQQDDPHRGRRALEHRRDHKPCQYRGNRVRQRRQESQYLRRILDSLHAVSHNAESHEQYTET